MSECCNLFFHFFYLFRDPMPNKILSGYAIVSQSGRHIIILIEGINIQMRNMALFSIPM